MKSGDARQKSVLITGATDGLGRALALLLAQRGYRVFGAGRSPEKLAQLDGSRVKNIFHSKASHWMFATTSRRPRNQQRARQSGSSRCARQQCRRQLTAAVEDLSMPDWRAQFETISSAYSASRAAVLPHMRERRSGRILMMSSLSGLVTPPTQGAYSSSKPRARRLHMRSHGALPFRIDIVLIEPGYTSSPAIQKRQPSCAALYAKSLDRNARSTRGFSPSATTRAPNPEPHRRLPRVMLHARRRGKAGYGVTLLSICKMEQAPANR